MILSLIEIPFTFYSIDYIYGCIEGSSRLYKNKSISYDSYYLLLTVPCHLVLIFLSVSEILFGNIPNYSNKNSSRAHSSVHIQEFFFIQAIAFASIVVDPSYFIYLFLALSVYLFYSYLYYLPYIYPFFNRILVQTWSSTFFCCILIVFSSIFENFFIVELNFPLIFIVLCFISREFVSQRTKFLVKVRKPQNAFVQELKLRCEIQADPKSEEICKRIFDSYSEANKNFYYFSIQYIWEAILIKKYSKNVSLALVKLVKVNTYLFKPNKSNQQSTSYPYSLEVDFLLYSLFNKFSKSVKDSSIDLALIKYFTYYKKISKFDEKILTFLLDFTHTLETDTSSKAIKNRIDSIGRLIKNYKTLAKKVTIKFGVDKKFARMYGTFLRDILNSSKGESLLENYGLSDKMSEKALNESSEFDRWDPVLIISGWYQNIGTIVYANSAIYKLLRIDMENKLIGSNFMELIPEPFDVIHDNVLYRYLFYRNSTELIRSHLFLLDVDRYCIEVTMKFKLAFYKCNPYFIASFKVFNSGKNMILCSTEGKIFSYSEGIKFIFSEMNFNIFTALPDIEEYLKAHDYEEHFLYSAFGRNFYMKKSFLQIDGYEMLILYLVDYEHVENRRISISNNNKKVVHLEEILEDGHKQTGTFKEKELKKDSMIQENQEEKDLIYLKTATKASKILANSVKTLVIIEILITVSILLIILQIIQSISVNRIIFDIGLMRYLSCSILSSTQSLELLSTNFTLAFNESFYKSSLLENSNLLNQLLQDYRDITLPFLNQKRDYFSTSKVKIIKFVNTSYFEEEVSLLNAIQETISISQFFGKTGLSNDSSSLNKKKFLYRNLPSSYINSLHVRVVTVMKDLEDSLGQIFTYLSYLELVCIMPPVILMIISAFCIFYIEKSNKAFWGTLAGVGRGQMIEAQTRMMERLSFFHEKEVVNESPSSTSKKRPYKRMMIFPCLKIFMFFLVSLIFYFSITMGPQELLHSTMKSQLNHTNYGGMRRMLTPLTLFWSRDSLLYRKQLESYVEKVPDYEISSSFDELERRSRQLVSVQNELMHSIKDFPDKRYDFQQYLKLMYGNACDIISNVEMCEGTLVSKGVDFGMKEYVRKAEYLHHEDLLINFSFVRVEQYSKVIEKSFVFGLSVYANYTDSIEERLKGEMTVATFMYLFVLIIFYAGFLHGVAEGMIRNIESKAEILAVFIKNSIKNARKTRSSSLIKHSFLSTIKGKNIKF